ncbi:MAG: zinc-ribbon domain-containing protein [Deltaproteobacteria bacterium]|nr:zinc-ribbon domain-containing protein [Deltaproteobacteria bacterium]
MIVTCERCNARYKLDDSRIKGRGARITCPRCHHVFTILVDPPAERAAEPAPDPGVEPGPPEGGSGQHLRPLQAARLEVPQGSADRLDFRKVGIATWKVKVKSGLVYDFSDIRTLRKYIQDHRVTEDDVISWDGLRWTRIGDIPNLDAFFLQVYEERVPVPGPALAQEEAEDAPTIVVGMGTLGYNRPTGVFERPDLASDASLAEASEPSSPGDAHIPRFVDPFEALKKSRLKAKGRSSPVQDPGTVRGGWRVRTAFVAGLAVVTLLAVAWFIGSRPAPEAPARPVATTPALPDASDFRAQMRDRIEQQLEQRDPLPLEPEPEEALRPVVPPDAALRRGTSPALTLSPPSIAPPSPASVADLAARGDALREAGDWAAATDTYARAAALDPGNAGYRFRYGEGLVHSGRPAEARQVLEAASLAGVAAAHKLLGDLARDRQDVQDAVTHYQEYLKSEPPDRAAIEQVLRDLSDD